MSDSGFYSEDVGSGEEHVKEDKENNFVSPNNTNTVTKTHKLNSCLLLIIANRY